MPHTSVTLILVSNKPPVKLIAAKLITLHVFLYDSIQPSTNQTTCTPLTPTQPFFQISSTAITVFFCDVINSFLGVSCTVNKEHLVWSTRLSVRLWHSISGHRFSGSHKVPPRLSIYSGADKSLARTTSRCIYLMVRIFRLTLVLFYIYINIYKVLIFLQLWL
jgi:hypothetical protein